MFLLSIWYFFIISPPPPLVSRQVGFLPKFTPVLTFFGPIYSKFIFFSKFVWDRGVAPQSFVFLVLDDLPGGEGGNNEKIPNTEKKHPEKVLLKV